MTNAKYEQAYADGESSRDADWQFAMDETAGVPEDVAWHPGHVADWIKHEAEFAHRMARFALAGTHEIVQPYDPVAPVQEEDRVVAETHDQWPTEAFGRPSRRDPWGDAIAKKHWRGAP